MNLLVGVLGQNFELYEEQSAILFYRARAKMLLELQARPWKHIFWLLFQAVLKEEAGSKDAVEDEEEVDSKDEVEDEGNVDSKDKSVVEPEGVNECEVVADPLLSTMLAFSWLPLAPLWIYAFGRDELNLGGLKRKALAEHLVRLATIYRAGFVMIIMLLPVSFALSACLALLLIIGRCIFQCQLPGMFYRLAVALGFCGPRGTATAQQCRIWLVLRPEPPIEDLRSVRSEVKNSYLALEKSRRRNPVKTGNTKVTNPSFQHVRALRRPCGARQ